jgi:hypothetical protein
VRASRVVSAAAAAVGLTLLAAWVFEWSFEKAALLAPVIVVAVGAAAGLVVLWTRVAWESLRHNERRGRVLALTVVALAVIAALSLLGVKLPRE